KRLQPKELWIEWNGMVSFHQLEALLYSDILSHLLQVEKVLYICTDQFVSTILPGLGNDVMSQLYSADCIITESNTHHALLRTYNGEAKIITAPTPEKVEQLCRNSTWGLIPNLLVIGITTYILLVTAFRHDIPYSIHQCFLIDRGIPLSVALLFMLASPIINPITILSTWYAFPDNPMLSVWRIVLGLGVALLVALSFRFWPPATSILKARTPQNLSYEEIVLETTKTKHIDKKRLLVHMEREFSQLLFYFSMAATVLSIVQVYGKPWLLNAGLTLPEFTAIPILLMLAFFFSVCSTSDAIIGKSLSTLFPISSVMGFLILGPMLDIKNVLIIISVLN
ncbi:MAG: permease, partial [Veillonella sp.]|nr:permease [Veillonella sp.]